MRRREFLTSGAALFLFMGSAAAESYRVWRVAFVASGSARPAADAFRNALHDYGYEYEKNFVLDVRGANGNYSLLPGILREVVGLKPDVIVAVATPAIAAAQKATSTIPIVMSPATDPIGSGFVRSYAHPGGNITGVANMLGDLTAKSLDILHVVLPNLKKIGVLISNNPTHPALAEVAKHAAETLGLSAERFTAATADDLEASFEAMRAANCEAVYVVADAYRPAMAGVARKFALPAMYQVDVYVRDGGLMSYGPDLLAMPARAAYYVDKIIKGANPADMPVEQPTKFHFLVNLRTAKALGLTIPESVLPQADEVIE